MIARKKITFRLPRREPAQVKSGGQPGMQEGYVEFLQISFEASLGRRAQSGRLR